MHTYMQTYTHTHIQTHICIHTHTYIYTYIHTYTYTNNHTYTHIHNASCEIQATTIRFYSNPHDKISHVGQVSLLFSTDPILYHELRAAPGVERISTREKQPVSMWSETNLLLLRCFELGQTERVGVCVCGGGGSYSRIKRLPGEMDGGSLKALVWITP